MLKLKFLSFAGIILLFISSVEALPQTDSGKLSSKDSARSTINADSLLNAARQKNEKEFTVPSYTLLRRAIREAENDKGTAGKLMETLKSLKPAGTPYNITININGDPSTQMAFNWFTNAGITGGKVQIVEGIVNDEKKFSKPLITVEAECFPVNEINYCIRGNNLDKLAGIPDNTKKSYTAHKAAAGNLKPGTAYSYRIGNGTEWSSTGTFRTAGRNDKEFSFIYTTDPQATTDADFHISCITTSTAFSMYPDVNFWLCCGDHVNASGANNSEWEWEQFFETQQNILMNKPFAPVLGNHDKSPNRNFTYHFNTAAADFDRRLSTTPGSVYSFVYGNALFLALSFEDYSNNEFIEAQAKWMRSEVEKHPEVKWRIAFYHKNIYTGSVSHQDDSDGITVRNRMAPLFDSLKIDIALQGHDHIYEVIGPVKNKKPVPNSITARQTVPPDKRENVTGFLHGIFNVSEGTLYFLNNSAGKKKYEPRAREDMEKDEERLGVPGYFSLFTGRFGQTGRPTFSHINVTDSKITITTYEVYDNGTASLFDRFDVVK